MLKAKMVTFLIAGFISLVIFFIKRIKKGGKVDFNRTLLKLVGSCLNIVLLIIVNVINVFAEAFTIFKVTNLEKSVITTLIVYSIYVIFSSCKLITKYMSNLEKNIDY